MFIKKDCKIYEEHFILNNIIYVYAYYRHERCSVGRRTTHKHKHAYAPRHHRNTYTYIHTHTLTHSNLTSYTITKAILRDLACCKIYKNKKGNPDLYRRYYTETITDTQLVISIAANAQWKISPSPQYEDESI